VSFWMSGCPASWREYGGTAPWPRRPVTTWLSHLEFHQRLCLHTTNASHWLSYEAESQMWLSHIWYITHSTHIEHIQAKFEVIPYMYKLFHCNYLSELNSTNRNHPIHCEMPCVS
jgi:hypothetical protein